MKTPVALKLMADYECWPLWDTSEGEFENVDPATLDIPGDLIRRLAAWAEAFDATLNRDDPGRSGFTNSRQHEAFEMEGVALWWQLQIVFPDTEISYFSDFFGREYLGR